MRKKISLLLFLATTMMSWTSAFAQTAAEYEAALAAINDGASYRISTTVDETKYYVTNGGGLSTDRVAAGVFTFVKITEGGEYVYDGENKAVGIQINTTDGKRFTNGPLSGDKAVLDNGSFATSTNNRANWETQVFFLNESNKFAIRTCNTAYGETSWTDAGRTFWTYDVEPVAPMYTYTATFVWDLEEVTVTPEQEAAMAVVKAWPFFVQSAAGLVKNAEKYYSNAKETSEGSYEALLDDNYSTFFHSAWSAGGAVDEDHYLQAELGQPTQKFMFYFKKRQQNNNNRPTTIVISASNDGTTFDEITTLDSGFPTAEYVIDYMSNVVDLGAAYKYVRFTVTATNNGAVNGNTDPGHVFFTFSEFYMFPGLDAANQAAAAYNKYANTVVDDLTPVDIATINGYDAALRAAFSTVNVTYELYEADGTTLVGTQTVVQEPGSDVDIPAALISLANTKFYDITVAETIVDATDCTIKVIRTLKPGFVGSLADLSNEKAYFITCDRGKFLTKDDYLASTAHSSLTEAEPTTFAILKYEDNYYLYSVADSKFVTNTGALIGDLVTEGFHGTFDAIQMEPKTVPYFFWYFTVAEGTNYGLNTNGNDPYGYVINNWMNADPGNQYYMVADADFDPTNAIAALDAFFHPAYTVTYVVKDVAGNTLFTSEPQPTTLGAVISTLPNDFKRGYYSYNEDDVEVTIADLETTVEFTATWEGPFELSADFAAAHWYNMSMRGTWYVTTDVKDGDGAYKTQNANTMGLGEDSYQWAFMGNGYDGFKIINKAEGEGKSFGWTDANQTNAGIPTVMDDAEGNHAWKIVASTNTTVPAGSFCLNVPGTDLYINQYGGAGGSVKFWNSANNVGDAGSAFTVYEVPTDFSEYVINEVAPALEATGYFTFTDAAKAEIGYDPAYKENCPFETFKSMKQKMAAAMEDVNNFILPENGFYTLTNRLYSTYMGIDPSDANMYGNYKNANAPKHIIKLNKKAGNKYTISLMGKYAPATVAQSGQVTAGTEAGAYTVSVPAVGFAAFQADPEAQYSALHCASGGSVVGWEPAAEASQWAVEKAISINLEIGESGYETAYLPFPVTPDAPLTVPEPKAAWTFDDGTTNGTGELVASEGVTFADGAVTVPAGEKLTMTTGLGDLNTYSFMMDVKINNEDNGRYTALYSNKVANDGDGSLFFYNHKTNGRGVGLNAGGLGYGKQGGVDLETMYRVVFVSTDAVASVYLNGEKVAEASAPITEHWVMHDVAHFFADNDGEENEVTCDEIRFWDQALTPEAIAMLGTPGTVIDTSFDLKVYTATIKEDDGTTPGEYLFLDMHELEGTIPSATPVILKATPNIYVFNIGEDDTPTPVIPDGDLGIYDDTTIDGGNALVKEKASDIDNDLKGTFEPLDATDLYVLAKPDTEDEYGFFKVDGFTLQPCKAYIELPTGTEIKGLKLKFEEPTGIANVEKAVENGYIYNVAGQRLNKMQKGINIMNGKKVLY